MEEYHWQTHHLLFPTIVLGDLVDYNPLRTHTITTSHRID